MRTVVGYNCVDRQVKATGVFFKARARRQPYIFPARLYLKVPCCASFSVADLAVKCGTMYGKGL
jgi:hypothetical protein